MHVAVTSIFVDDQARALDFYTRVLGFRVRHDIPMGEFRWLTVVDPEAPEGTEVVLEPNAHPAAQSYQQALVADRIPCTFFTVDDLAAEHEALQAKGVRFTTEPTAMGPNLVAVLDDTCGNLLQLVQLDGAVGDASQGAAATADE